MKLRSMEQLNDFIEKASNNQEMWKFIEMKIVAKEIGENEYDLLGLHGTVHAIATPMSKILFDLENIIMIHEIMPTTHKKFKKMIIGFKNGIVKVGEKEFNTKKFSNFDFGTSFGNRRGPFNVEWDWPYFWLRSHGTESIREYVNEDEINLKLKMSGYQDLFSACKENLGFEIGFGHAPHIHFIVPIYISTNAKIENEKLILSILYHKSVLVEELNIGYQIEGDIPKHGKICSDDYSTPNNEKEFYMIEKNIDLPNGTKSVRFWTIYNDQLKPLDENWISVPIVRNEDLNLRWKIIGPLFSKMDSGNTLDGTKIFERNLGLVEKKPSADAFESAVLNLMSIAGFEVVFAGKGFDAQGIDILAFSPDSQDVITISCTIGNDIRKKIRTFLPQINQLKTQLNDYELTPAIFAPINPEDIINSDRNDATDQQISLLLSREIEEIYRALQTTSVSEIKKFVLNYVKDRISTAA